ncbi:MAG TPA: DUF262 domain-containing protein [Candidatus Acidoferrales bacterium]|nr:DUF262 domain-containing protein [Candidatus Acidoferrales bacterium]
MQYKNTEIKLNVLVNYFNEGRINLAPVFQRGRAWKIRMRQELIKNIVRKRPIPAIFMYKKEADAKYVYTILDGKQRIESILMFIRDDNPALKINTWKDYISEVKYRHQSGFPVKVAWDNKRIPFSKFPNDEIRTLGEYVIPTIEISLDEDTNLDEIIELFVDINSYGARVTRTDIIKAIKRDDPLLKSVYKLIAEKRPKGMDIFTKVSRTMFRRVLRKLSLVTSAADKHAEADRMWDKLMELVLFLRSGNTHSKGPAALKKFMDATEEVALKASERQTLKRTFSFLDKAYRKGLEKTRLATDYVHFYIMTTSLLQQEIFPVDLDDAGRAELIRKLIEFGKLMVAQPLPKDDTDMGKYLLLSSKQTTDAKKRADRQKLFKDILATL